MSDSNTDSVRAKVLRDFTDAGTERSYSAKQVVTLSEGEFLNFSLAGLVEADDAAQPVADEA